MGRPKEFETEHAIYLASQIFWRKGYAATSVADLESGLGIGRKSLYDTFGDKRSLFLLILDKYTSAPYPVSRSDASLAEIEQMFTDSPSLDSRYRACLLANTTLEFGVEQDEEVAARIQKHLRRMEACFGRAIERAIAQGELPEQCVRASARYLTSCFQGVAVMAKGGASEATLKDIIAVTLSTLKQTHI